MTTRLNARVDAELARKVKYLRERTGASTTEVLRTSVEAYYEVVKRAERPASLLVDFIGCFEGPEDLSENHRTLQAEALATKYPSAVTGRAALEAGHSARRNVRRKRASGGSQ